MYPGAIIESHLSGSISLELPIIVIRIYMLLMVNLHAVGIIIICLKNNPRQGFHTKYTPLSKINYIF